MKSPALCTSAPKIQTPAPVLRFDVDRATAPGTSEADGAAISPSRSFPEGLITHFVSSARVRRTLQSSPAPRPRAAEPRGTRPSPRGRRSGRTSRDRRPRPDGPSDRRDTFRSSTTRLFRDGSPPRGERKAARARPRSQRRGSVSLVGSWKPSHAVDSWDDRRRDDGVLVPALQKRGLVLRENPLANGVGHATPRTRSTVRRVRATSCARPS